MIIPCLVIDPSSPTRPWVWLRSLCRWCPAPRSGRSWRDGQRRGEFLAFAVADRAGVRGRRVVHGGGRPAGVWRDTRRKWRSRFLVARLEGGGDEARPDRALTITHERIELVITKMLEEGTGDRIRTGGRGRWQRLPRMSQSAVADLMGVWPQAVVSALRARLTREPIPWSPASFTGPGR